jgi:hypothetical protein
MTQDEEHFSMPRDKIVSHVKESRRELTACRHLIKYFLRKTTENRWLITALCDVYSANYKLLSELSIMLEYASDKEQNVVLMTKDDLAIVEAIMIARHYTTRELQLHGNVSMSVH